MALVIEAPVWGMRRPSATSQYSSKIPDRSNLENLLLKLEKAGKVIALFVSLVAPEEIHSRQPNELTWTLQWVAASTGSDQMAAEDLDCI